MSYDKDTLERDRGCHTFCSLRSILVLETKGNRTCNSLIFYLFVETKQINLYVLGLKEILIVVCLLLIFQEAKESNIHFVSNFDWKKCRF